VVRPVTGSVAEWFGVPKASREVVTKGTGFSSIASAAGWRLEAVPDTSIRERRYM
jgi:hypothetical protein